MSAPELSVREAARHDTYALWIWANDPDTRAASRDRPAIPWGDHRSWLEERLKSSKHLVLLAETAEQRPVGTIRFDTVDQWLTARLSYTVAPEARGHGLSRTLVMSGVQRLRLLHPQVAIKADVMSMNVRSRRVFERLGWQQEANPTEAVRFWLR